jgi:hypothetical protein
MQCPQCRHQSNDTAKFWEDGMIHTLYVSPEAGDSSTPRNPYRANGRTWAVR